MAIKSGFQACFCAYIPSAELKAIRIFIDMSGWIPEYTNSGKENEFLAFNIPNRG
jgi:cupin superfamily acireductone dioxygenase involved in methionine salvage